MTTTAKPEQPSDEPKPKPKPRYIVNFKGHIEIAANPICCGLPWDLFDQELARAEQADKEGDE